MEKEIKFIARHYRKGLFDREKALRRIGIRHNRWWTPIKVAAASVAFVVLGATAGPTGHRDNKYSHSRADCGSQGDRFRKCHTPGCRSQDKRSLRRRGCQSA